MSDMKTDNHTSESDITDVDEDHTPMGKVKQQTSIVSRRPATNGRKIKASPANNSRLNY